MDRKFLLTAFAYGIVGLALGIHMASTKQHGQLVTHAHIMLLGFIVTFVYALCHRLWLPDGGGRLANLQFYAHHAGSIVMFAGLYGLYGGLAQESVLGPLLGISSIVVMVSLLLMMVMLVRAPTVASH